MIKSQKSVNKGQSKEKVIKKRSSKKGLAEIEENDFFITLGKKTEALRPPVVWNYPIERIDTTPHQVTLIKKEIQKNEIRKTNPFSCYHDQRIEKFLELFNEL